MAREIEVYGPGNFRNFLYQAQVLLEDIQFQRMKNAYRLCRSLGTRSGDERTHLMRETIGLINPGKARRPWCKFPNWGHDFEI